MKKIVYKKGFTMIELIIGVAVFLLLVLGVTLFARNTWTYNSFTRVGLNNVTIGRKAMKTMSTEIRVASAANNGSYAVNQASATSFIFFADINGDGLKERIRYFLNGTLLQRGVIIPSGSPLAYTATETITTLLSNVTNASIFSYYNSSYDGTTAALTTPIDVSAVRLVKITATIDDDPARPPAPTTFTTQISLRNVKDNL